MIKWGIVFGTQTIAATKPVNPLNIKQIAPTKQPLEIFSKLQNHYQNTYLLESIEGPQKLAQYSFLGFDPKTTIQITNGKAKIINQRNWEASTEETSNPLDVIEQTSRKRGRFKQPVSICWRSSRLHLV